jgi:hypothetical protein
MFHEGDAVICIDASDLPSPPWHPLTCGATYVVRSIERIPLNENGNYNGNIHKRAKYGVKLWGISNPVNPLFGKELAYADSRFVGTDSNIETEQENFSIPVESNLVLEAA